MLRSAVSQRAWTATLAAALCVGCGVGEEDDGIGAYRQAVTFPATGFDPCRFNFGTAFTGSGTVYPAAINYTTMWAGSGETFNMGEFFRAHAPGGKLAGKTPVIYSYIIAFTARRDLGLKDCDVGTPNLCQQGATFIRQKRARILQQYDKYARGAAATFGTTEPSIWLMEPDFYQYTNPRQDGGGLSRDEAATLLGELMGTVKQHLPNAVFSMDISPWVPDADAWFKSLGLARFDFMNTSGGRTDADSAKIRNENNMRWAEVFATTGKRIIADDGYGVGGAGTGHDPTWDDVNNLNARIADGVIAITQVTPGSDWSTALMQRRAQLTAIPSCDPSVSGGSGAIPVVGSGGAGGSGGGGGMTADAGAPAPQEKENVNEFFGVGCTIAADAASRSGSVTGALGAWFLALMFLFSRHRPIK